MGKSISGYCKQNRDPLLRKLGLRGMITVNGKVRTHSFSSSDVVDVATLAGFAR